jgi:hypothetical protein
MGQGKNEHGWYGFKLASCSPTLPTLYIYPLSTLATNEKRKDRGEQDVTTGKGRYLLGRQVDKDMFILSLASP